MTSVRVKASEGVTRTNRNRKRANKAQGAQRVSCFAVA